MNFKHNKSAFAPSNQTPKSMSMSTSDEKNKDTK